MAVLITQYGIPSNKKGKKEADHAIYAAQVNGMGHVYVQSLRIDKVTWTYNVPQEDREDIKHNLRSAIKAEDAPEFDWASKAAVTDSKKNKWHTYDISCVYRPPGCYSACNFDPLGGGIGVEN
jgi:hypothetical protein